MGRTSDARSRLIRSAAGLIHERGYTAVGVNAICTAAGVRKGSFYHFFRSKRELAMAALDELWERYRGPLDEMGSGDAPPLDRLRRFLRAVPRMHVEIKRDHGRTLGCPFGNLALELSSRDETVRKRMRDLFGRYVTRFEAVLAEAVDRGDLPPQDARRSARGLVALMEGAILMAKTEDRPELLRDLPDQAFRLLDARGNT